MIKPICDRCGKELEDFGGILLSPPEGRKVSKFHMCKACYGEVVGGFVNK